MDKFLETYNLPRLNQEEIDKLNRPITSSEIRFVVKKKKPPSNQKSWARWLHGGILPNTERINSYPSQTIPKNWRRRNTLKLILWGHHQYQITQCHYQKYYRPISLMNTNANIFHQILASQTQQYIKESYTMIKLDLFQGHKDGSTYANLSMWYSTLTKGKIKIIWLPQ